jgi:hypothetical protein
LPSLIWWSNETLSVSDVRSIQIVVGWTHQSDGITPYKSDNLSPSVVECPTMDIDEGSVGYFRIPAGDSPSD